MLLSEFLKKHGFSDDLTAESPQVISEGVRILLFLLSRSNSRGAPVSIGDDILMSEWPSSVDESFAESLKQAVELGFVKKTLTGYSLTSAGKSAWH